MSQHLIDKLADCNESLQQEVERLKAENSDLKTRIDGGIRVYAYYGNFNALHVIRHSSFDDNATLILDEGVSL
jgi:hypothetical protein